MLCSGFPKRDAKTVRVERINSPTLKALIRLKNLHPSPYFKIVFMKKINLDLFKISIIIILVGFLYYYRISGGK